MFSQDWIFVREIIKKVRELAPESLPLAGGEHITAIPELDLCIVREGESAFTEFLQKVDTGQDYSEVGSLVDRDSSQKNRPGAPYGPYPRRRFDPGAGLGPDADGKPSLARAQLPYSAWAHDPDVGHPRLPVSMHLLFQSGDVGQFLGPL